MTGTEGELEALLAFLYAAPVGLVRTLPDGSIELVNSAAMRLLLPLAAQPARLSNLFDALAPAAGDLRALVQQADPAPGPLLVDRRLQLLAPGQRPDAVLHASLSLYRLGDGALMAVLADATAQVRGEQLLRAGEARLRFVLDAADIGDWDLDLDTGSMTVQGAFERCLGQAGAGAPWTLDRLMQTLHDDDRDAAFIAFDRALASGDDWRVEVRLSETPAGARWVLLNGRLLGAAGRGRRMLGIVQDITDRRVAEASRLEMRRLSDEMRLVEQSARMRTEFLARMSHEFRTPLHGIIGMAQVLRRRLQAPGDLQALEHIERAGAHLAGLADDVLDLAKVDAGQMSLRSEPFDLDAVFEGALDLVAGRAGDKGVALVLDASDLPAQLVGDAGRLKQALINLLANAVRFTERGHVALRARRGPADGDAIRLHFEVEDTGSGIPAEAQARLFQPYAQVDGAAAGGTGLGLAMTRHIARLMGGDAGVQSTEGAGSRFWFDACFGAVAAGPAPATPAFADRAVLLVDELAASREALVPQLRSLGLRVGVAHGTADALERVAQALAAPPAPAALLVCTGAGSPGGARTLEALQRRFGASMPPVLRLADGSIAGDAPGLPTLQRPPTTTALRAALSVLLAPQPPAAAAQTPEMVESQLRDRHAGRRVLVVEDNPVNQEVARSLLDGVGLLVDVADDGEQALAMALAGRYDLVLMDMQMPVMDGLTATRLLRERLGPGLPVVGFSANAYDEGREACQAAGMDDHLSKPVHADVLFACVLRWLDAR